MDQKARLRRGCSWCYVFKAVSCALECIIIRCISRSTFEGIKTSSYLENKWIKIFVCYVWFKNPLEKYAICFISSRSYKRERLSTHFTRECETNNATIRELAFYVRAAKHFPSKHMEKNITHDLYSMQKRKIKHREAKREREREWERVVNNKKKQLRTQLPVKTKSKTL